MHHIHYFIVQGDTAQDAIGSALCYIEEWGDENNWRSAVGAFHKNGRKTNAEESNHFGVQGRTLKKTNEMFNQRITKADTGWGTDKENYEKIKNTMRKLVDGDFSAETVRATDSMDIYAVKSLVKHIDAMKDTLTQMREPRPFDVFKDEYMPYKYHEVGVTHIDSGAGDRVYCVLIDIHT